MRDYTGATPLHSACESGDYEVECGEKKKEWAVICKTRAEELQDETTVAGAAILYA